MTQCMILADLYSTHFIVQRIGFQGNGLTLKFFLVYWISNTGNRIKYMPAAINAGMFL